MICFFCLCFFFIYFFLWLCNHYFLFYMVVTRYFESFFFSVLLHYVIVFINADFAYELLWRKLSICILYQLQRFLITAVCVGMKNQSFRPTDLLLFTISAAFGFNLICFGCQVLRVGKKTELGTQNNNKHNLLNLL